MQYGICVLFNKLKAILDLFLFVMLQSKNWISFDKRIFRSKCWTVKILQIHVLKLLTLMSYRYSMSSNRSWVW